MTVGKKRHPNPQMGRKGQEEIHLPVGVRLALGGWEGAKLLQLQFSSRSFLGGKATPRSVCGGCFPRTARFGTEPAGGSALRYSLRSIVLKQQ